MALMATLSDDFNAPSRDTAKWTQFATSPATIAQSGGAVTCTPGTSTAVVAYAGYDSVATPDLTGSAAAIQIVQAVNAASGTQQYFKLTKDGSNNVQWILENGTLKPQKTVATVTSDITAGVTFNATTHAYWRIRESGGNTFFDFSADSITWTNHTSLANPFVVTAMQVEFAAGTFSSNASPGAGIFDNFNVVPLESWIHPTNEPLRKRVLTRQQPPAPKPNAVPRVSAAPYVSYWKQPTNEPLRNRVPKRQLPPGYKNVPPGRVSAAPYLSYWKRPVEQFLRNRTRTRQQPQSASYEPFYSNSAVVVAPSVAGWKRPDQSLLRKRLRPRQQPEPNQPTFPVAASQAPYISYWKQPVNQFLRNRLPKRQQPRPPQPTFPEAVSQAPYVSYWVHPTNQPLRNRVPKRQIPKKAQPPYPAQASQAPYVSYWRQPVNQPLRTRLKQYRRHDPRVLPPPASAMPPLESWAQDVNQPLRGRVPKRQLVGTKYNPFYSIPVIVVPLVTTWLHPVQQFVRKRLPKRQQPVYNYNRFIPTPAPPAPIFVDIAVVISTTAQAAVADDDSVQNINSSATINTISAPPVSQTDNGENNKSVINTENEKQTLEG